MTIRQAGAPIALALALALGACGKSGTDANATATNEVLLNDEGLLSNDEAANLVDEGTAGNSGELDNAATVNSLGSNETAGGNAL